MASEMGEAIRQLMQEKGISEDSVKLTIENMLKAAYKRTYGTADNAVVVFEDDLSDVTIYSRKTVVDGVYDPIIEIELEEARQLDPECEEGDEIDIPEDPKTWGRSAVSTGKQTGHQGLNESFKDNLYNEYKDKIGEIIIGYYQREKNGNIYVDLGKVEGVLPAKFQSPREKYEKNERIKALIVDIKKTTSGIQIVLSRSDPEFVRSIVELEVPEVYDKTVEIYKIVRDAGYRTKIAVYTNREDVDPVGACVGLKGNRIQNVITELLGEKIDVLKYDSDPTVFIKNALSPAEVSKVVILDAEKKQALAIVPDTQFSLAIGKQGQNVRLANRLCDWTIDVKTEEQAATMDLSEFESRKAAINLFKDDDVQETINAIAELPGIDVRVADILKEAGIADVQQFVDAYEEDALKNIEGLTADDIEAVNKIINENVEFVEESEEPSQTEAPSEADAQENAGGDAEEEYFCPECGAKITLDMTHCPKCGVEFEFEEDEE
ncbi:MAG: transcription termination/antitermination protein NusA [Treponema sp.]|uniref:transcription termination factor NusA n=1 Tax=Treponema sp. TaxID=166 RepID=UPI001B736125|nr:transcription termination factor NusA [Treponema sp.]MBP5403055.1 transcription termination/antitermination protein NusA [Treponema sp.]MBR5934274.1 transcription termination/antitermination protein NusA [Treponema sp.]